MTKNQSGKVNYSTRLWSERFDRTRSLLAKGSVTRIEISEELQLSPTLTSMVVSYMINVSKEMRFIRFIPNLLVARGHVALYELVEPAARSIEGNALDDLFDPLPPRRKSYDSFQPHRCEFETLFFGPYKGEPHGQPQSTNYEI